MNLKHFKLKKELFTQYEEFARAKLDYVWFKKLIFGMMGGLFIGIGYIGTLMVSTITGVSETTSKLLSVAGSLLFPVGLLLCIYLGGNLFTSNCMGLISVVCKERKWYHYIFDLSLTFIGNWIGSLIIALIAWGAGLFGIEHIEGERAAKIIDLAKQKFDASHDHDWWNNILSGILCNILVVACTMVSILTNKKGVGAFVVYLILVVFVISGYQHVVANMFIFTEAGLLSTHATDAQYIFTAHDVGKMFYINIIPTMLGNWIGGAIMSSVYMWASSYVKKNDKLEEQMVSVNITPTELINDLSIQDKQQIWDKSAKQVTPDCKCSLCKKHKKKMLEWDDGTEICSHCFVRKGKKDGKKGTV